MLAAEARDAAIRICMNVSTAKKTRIMRDKICLTMACRESSHPFPCLHGIGQELWHFAAGCSQVPGRTWASAQRDLNHVRGSAAGRHLGSQLI